MDDSSASIGKRYSRNDELGTPFGATVDFASSSIFPPILRLQPHRFVTNLDFPCFFQLSRTEPSPFGSSLSFPLSTRRVSPLFFSSTTNRFFSPTPYSPRSERDTTQQRIGPIDEVIKVISDLKNGTINWEQACEILPVYSGEQEV